jgi:hypothetical protein
MNQAVAAARLPVHEQRAAVAQLEIPQEDEPGLRIATLVLPAVEKVTVSAVRSATEARCVVVALACERHRLRNQRWPEALADLAPTFLPVVPLDPITDAPLGYAKVPEGIIVYSRGWDGSYTGGSMSEPNERTPVQARFRLWNPDQRRRPAPEPEE